MSHCGPWVSGFFDKKTLRHCFIVTLELCKWPRLQNLTSAVLTLSALNCKKSEAFMLLIGHDKLIKIKSKLLYYLSCYISYSPDLQIFFFPMYLYLTGITVSRHRSTSEPWHCKFIFLALILLSLLSFT